MGGAVSKNTAEAIADVSNSITNTTTTSNQNISNQKNVIIQNKCDIETKGKYNVNQKARLAATLHQIAQGASKSDVKNDIQQKMMQSAMSTVGSMGIGYADASNSASMFSSASNDVVNTVKTEASQISDVSNVWTCNDSVIRALNDVNINQSLSGDFLSDQIAKSNNVVKLANRISQVAQQKATAKVEGLAGFILALAILILACGYSFYKAASAGGVLKILTMVAVIVVLGIILVFMYLKKTPPLFSDPEVCSPNFSYGTGDKKCKECVKMKHQTLSLEHTPMKYMFSLISSPSGDTGIIGSLLEMVVSAKTSDNDMKNNRGYNVANANNVNKIADEQWSTLIKNKDIKNTWKPPPKILIIPTITEKDKKEYYKIPVQYTSKDGKCTPGKLEYDKDDNNDDFDSCPTKSGKLIKTENESEGIANLNISDWKKYLENGKNIPFARFFLLRLLESDSVRFDLSTYEDKDGNEPVVYKKNMEEFVDLAKNVKDKVAKYRNDKNQEPTESAKTGSGTIIGLFGICNNQQYKLRQFARKIGIWIVLLIVIGLGIFLLVTYMRNKSSSENK